MDTINFDVTNLIFKNLTNVDKLVLHQLFTEPKPTQFQVSYEMMKNKQIKGNKGLILFAKSSGELEACVMAAVILTESLWYDKPLSEQFMLKIQYERNIRFDYSSYDTAQRSDRLTLMYNKRKFELSVLAEIDKIDRSKATYHKRVTEKPSYLMTSVARLKQLRILIMGMQKMI